MSPTVLFLLIVAIVAPASGSTLRKLDESTVPVPPDSENKCGGCSACNNPCNHVPPPPPPQTPSPPPPSPSPPPPTPPSPKKPPSSYCPPPPPSSFIYLTGPPGNLYPVDQYFSGSGRSSGVTVGLPLLMGYALFGLVTFW